MRSALLTHVCLQVNAVEGEVREEVSAGPWGWGSRLCSPLTHS